MPLLIVTGLSMLEGGQPSGAPAAEADWLRLSLLIVSAWYLIYIWTNKTDVTRNVIRVPSPFCLQRSYPLGELRRLEDAGDYFLKLRFRGGRRAEVLKYVSGRATLIEALERRDAAVSEDSCPSSPKSKRCGAAFFR
ncbi:MAG: hypothetical protein AAGJ91_16705 [Pseudomonadota bacterium]